MKSKELRRQARFSIVPTKPFNFDGTFNKPSHYTSGCSEWQDGRYWQTIRLDSRIFGLFIKNAGTLNRPRLSVSVFYGKPVSSKDMERIKGELLWRFDLEANLDEFNRLVRSDKRFAPVFRKWVGMRKSSGHDLYELMMISIFLQNATIRRTMQMTKVMLENFGTRVRFDGKEIFAMWLPRELGKVSEEELRALKMGYRAKFIKRLSQDFVSGKVDELKLRKMDSQRAKEALMELYGVGPETARILLFEVLHDYGRFDHIAPWQQKIYSRLFYNRALVPTDRISADIKKAYGGYSMLAVHYIMEDIFWRRKTEHIPWLEKEIRL